MRFNCPLHSVLLPLRTKGRLLHSTSDPLMNAKVQFCPRCQRSNPPSAVFCYFDGCLLRQGAVGATTGKLLQEFIFPSGRRCGTFDELAQGCYYEWEDARDLLHDGTFASFLASIGRADPARCKHRSTSASTPRSWTRTAPTSAM